jgi:hypothetical protein
MNTIIKYCAITLIIALGFAMPLQAQVRGLYDVKVNFQGVGSTWDPWVLSPLAHSLRLCKKEF